MTTAAVPKTLTGRQNRRLRNLLLDPSRQLRSSWLFLGLYLVYSVALSLVFLSVTFEQHIFVMEYVGHSSEGTILDLFQNPIIVVGLIKVSVLFLIFLLVALFLTVLLSHRVFGPLVPIKRKIESMSKGNYSDRLVLRRGDELQDVAEALNGLSDKLMADREHKQI